MARRHGTHGRREPSRHSRRSPSHDREQQRTESDERQSQRAPGPRLPRSWRDSVLQSNDYADETEQMSRRERRREKSARRREDHAQRMAWLREQRRSEPASPAGLIAVVVLLAIVLLGLGGGLPRLFRGDESSKEPIGLLTPADGPEDSSEAPSSPPSSPTTTAASRPVPANTLPVVTQRPSAQSTAAANRVVHDWASVFYTRNPAGESYPELVARATKYTTAQVADSFKSAGDSTYEALRAAGGTSRVTNAPAGAPRPGIAPVDTPTRITRLVTVSVDVTGRQPAKLKVPLLVTVVWENGRWVISDVNGGTGP